MKKYIIVALITLPILVYSLFEWLSNLFDLLGFIGEKSTDMFADWLIKILKYEKQ